MGPRSHDFDGMAPRHCTSVVASLPNLSQQACHNTHIERPKSDQPEVFQGFGIEVSDGQFVGHDRLLYGRPPSISRNSCLARGEMANFVFGAFRRAAPCVPPRASSHAWAITASMRSLSLAPDPV